MNDEIAFEKIDEENDWKDVEYVGGLLIGSKKTEGDLYLVFSEKDGDETFRLRMQKIDFVKFMNMTAGMRNTIQEELEMSKVCEHTENRFIETVSREAMFQCVNCGKIWWENIEGRRDDERFIAKNIPEPCEYKENNPFKDVEQ